MNPVAQTSPPPSHRLFNTPLECGLRMLFLLDATAPSEPDLQRLISYDYLLVHSGDAASGPQSLHPAVPYRGSEWLVKRELVRQGLDLMLARELLDKRLQSSGIHYAGTSLTRAFIALLNSQYAKDLKSRAAWVSQTFASMSDAELSEYMTGNVGRWGAEFDRVTALQDLELA